MNGQREKVRRLQRRSRSLEEKIEELARRSPQVRRLIAMQVLQRETDQALRSELEFLGYIVAMNEPAQPSSTGTEKNHG